MSDCKFDWLRLALQIQRCVLRPDFHTMWVTKQSAVSWYPYLIESVYVCRWEMGLVRIDYSSQCGLAVNTNDHSPQLSQKDIPAFMISISVGRFGPWRCGSFAMQGQETDAKSVIVLCDCIYRGSGPFRDNLCAWIQTVDTCRNTSTLLTLTRSIRSICLC